jgi:hypothetical protein
MGTNSKSTHQSYVTAPTAVAEPAALAPAAGQAVLDPDLLSPAVLAGFEGLEIGGAGAGPEAIEPEQPVPEPAPESEPEPKPEPAATLPVEEPEPEPEPEAEPTVEESAQAVLKAQAAQELWQEAATPLPEELPVGKPFGVPVMVGGLELQDSAVTLMSYADGEGSREALMATVSPEAEAALLDALSASGVKMIPVESTEVVQARLATDKLLQIDEKVAKAAKAANGKFKHGEEMDETCWAAFNAAVDAVNEASQQATTMAGEDPVTAQAVASMVEHYQATTEAIYEQNENPQPYLSGGKVAHTTPFLYPTEQVVTTMVPAPPEEAGVGQLPASLRAVSRIKASMDEDGSIHWNGKSRTNATENEKGKEYVIDLGEGYTGVYRPHHAPEGHAQVPFSMRGQLEITAPAGPGHGQELVGKLAALNLPAAPAGAAEAELTYLKANITAQGLAGNDGVAAALGAGAHLTEMHVQELFHAEAHRAVGLDAHGLDALAREFQARGAKAAIPAHTGVLREAVAKATGYAGGESLAQSAGYQPTPQATAGWLTWSRFDVTGDMQKVDAAFKNKALTHTGGAKSVKEMLRAGFLASTERRRTMGVANVGMSEGADMHTGGANSVFLRVKSAKSGFTHGHGITLVWDQPGAMLADASVYGYNADMYGAVNPTSKDLSSMTRNPHQIAKFTASNNEVMFRNGLDLHGAAAPSRIITSSAEERIEVLGIFKAQGVTHLGGTPVEQIVKQGG